MSDYTTQIRFICESKSGLTESVGFSGIMEAIENSVDDIFNFEWPIFDEAYRVPLEIKILRHFYTREIGEETFGLWQLRLCDRLNVIMPYYNQLYESELIKFNPMYDVDLTTEHERANDGLIDKSENAVFNGNDSHTRTTERKHENLNDQIENISGESSDSKTENSNANDRDWRSNINSVTGENKGKNVNRFSDTPQGNVNIGNAPAGSTGGSDGNVDADSVFGNGYLTNVTIVDNVDKNKSESLTDDSGERITSQKIDSSGKNETKTDRLMSGVDSGTVNEGETVVGNNGHTNNITGKIKNVNTEDFIQRVSGKRGGLTYSKMLDEFRKTFLNIDRMILNDLESLFIGLWE